MTSNIFLGISPITTKYLLRETHLIEELLIDGQLEQNSGVVHHTTGPFASSGLMCSRCPHQQHPQPFCFSLNTSWCGLLQSSQLYRHPQMATFKQLFHGSVLLFFTTCVHITLSFSRRTGFTI